MTTARVLLTEGSSLTAREVVTCLGPAGHHIEVMDPDALCIARFSRWVRRLHRCPHGGGDPRGYLRRLQEVVAERAIDVVLPTHEQAWLLSVGRRLLPGAVRAVTDAQSRDAAARALLADGGPALAQDPAPGQYGQVQALFDRGRMVAVHTSVQRASGIGGSAAARRSVDHPAPREHVATLGAALRWHGGITLDYLHEDGAPQYIECNPRTVEPGNAAASGVNLPDLQVRLTLGEKLEPRVGRAGVRTHGTLALVLGAAANGGGRRAVLGELGRALARRGTYAASAEQLTPVRADPPSLAPLAFVAGRVVLAPGAAADVAAAAVRRYAIEPEAVAALEAG